MTHRPEPVMACAACGPIVSGPTSECPICPGLPGHDVYWVDLAAGLEHVLAFAQCEQESRLLADAANELRTLRDTIASMQQAQGGAKERRQGLKAARLATVIRETCAPFPVTAALVQGMEEGEWLWATQEANRRYGARHAPPSDKTKALVAQKFAQPQEAGR